GGRPSGHRPRPNSPELTPQKCKNARMHECKILVHSCVRAFLHFMHKLLIATTNVHKVAEIRDILSEVPFEILTLTDLPHVDVPEETGRTFAENARAKALHYARATGELTVAEDSGLEIDALDGAPGVESARFGGADASYPQKFSKLYDLLQAKSAIESAVHFVCALALTRGDRVLFTTRA